MKRLASALDSAPSQSGHKELVLNKRWTDGSVSWDSLPPALASLGKVKEGRAPLPEAACLLAFGVMRTSRQDNSDAGISVLIKHYNSQIVLAGGGHM